MKIIIKIVIMKANGENNSISRYSPAIDVMCIHVKSHRKSNMD